MSTTAWPELFDEILRSNLPGLTPDQALTEDLNLADVGLDSLGLVSLLVAVEDGFQVAFPDEVLAAGTFATAGSLWSVLSRLQAGR